LWQRAYRNEIVFDIIPQAGTRADMVDLKISHCSAVLTAPEVARKYFAAQLAIGFGFKA
jgi:hypothetical protein